MTTGVSPAEVEIHFLDVGQGDCTVALDLQARQALVIDCPASNARRVVDLLRGARVFELDVVITHWDLDHYGGAVVVAKEFSAQRLLYNHDTLLAGPDERSKRLAVLRSLLDAKLERTRLEPAVAGAGGSVGALRWSLLAPTHRELTTAVTSGDRNAGSAVVHLTCGDVAVLVAGDAQDGIWERLLATGSVPRTDVFRCAHHGGSTGQRTAATLAQVLADARPSHFLVSVGSRNNHRHPLPEVIRVARGAGARVLCTEATKICFPALGGVQPCAGDIRITTSGSGYDVTPTAVEHTRTIEAHRAALTDQGDPPVLCQSP